MPDERRLMAVECSGSLFEMGEQWGSACKEHLRSCFEVNIGAITMGYGVTPADASAIARKFIPLIDAFDSGYLEFVKGQAEGAGLAFDQMLTLRCTLELAAYYKQLNGLCTSFAAAKQATRDRKTILGQNIDWLSTFPIDLLKLRFKNGPTLLSLSLGGIVEYTLSSQGFGMCANSLFTSPENLRRNIPISCYLFKAMRQDTMQSAFNLLKENARGMAYFHLADANGSIVGLESDFDSYQIIRPQNGLLFHTNCYQSEQYQAKDMAPNMLPDSFKRRTRVQGLLNEAQGKITPDLMIKILADHKGHPNSICRHVDEALPFGVPPIETLASYIMVPEDGCMYIANGNPCQAKYIKYQL